MARKKDGKPPSDPTRKAEDEKKARKKGPSWAAGSFMLNLLRTWHNWTNDDEKPQPQLRPSSRKDCVSSPALP